MRLPRARGVRLALIAGAGLAGLLNRAPANDPDAERIAALVRQLGDPRYVRREAAGQGLAHLGEKALPAVHRATADADPEVGQRARQVVLAILRASGTSKSAGLELVAVEDGRFDMGAGPHEADRRPDERLHPVRIKRPFLVGKYEVTQAEYEKVMKGNPSWFQATGGGGAKLGGAAAGRLPVERVSWFDAVEFCNTLSGLDGYPPYYVLADPERAGGSIRRAAVRVAGGPGYRLPTEAEWEFACRGWTATAFHFGGRNTGAQANLRPGPATGYGDAAWATPTRTHAVGTYPPNARGLCDMHGNVAEWCGDWYDAEYYETSPAADPAGPAAGTHRTLRGGSWAVYERSGRSASRFYLAPGGRDNYAGFRVARSP